MRLLIIGTLSGQIGAASKIAISRGAKVEHVDDINSGLEALRAGRGADLLMVDVTLDVEELVNSLKSERFAVPVIACGVENDAKAAVRAIRAGAREYVPLPPDADLIAAVLTAVAEENSAIVHEDPRMAEVIALADKIAPSDASIMITGPSGTGKELMARHLHLKSKRAKNTFVAINCAAIPETLLESELFGYEKGSFTGAASRRIGKFEEANGGTLLLDEISEMAHGLQAKLLRALQEKEIDRIGSNKPVKVDVRILATSNRDMQAEVANGNFREDLYFRLNVVSLAIPPLRERPKDIMALARHFITKFSKDNDIAERPISKDVEQALLAHAWPGNVREMENAMHRAVLLASGTEIGMDAIMLDGQSSMSTAHAHNDGSAADTSNRGGLVGRTVSDVERELIIETLDHCLGNRTHAATILGISIRTLRNKLKTYTEQGFSVPSPSGGERSPA